MKLKLSLLLALAFLVSWPIAHADLILRQSTSRDVKIGPFVDSTGAALTGLTITNTDVQLSKNGATMAAKNSGGCAADVLGYYTCTLDATDSNTVGGLQLAVNETGALPVYHEYNVLPIITYDITYAAAATGFPTSPQVAELGIQRRGTAVSVTGTTLVMDAGASFGDVTLNGATVWACGSTQGYCQSMGVASNTGDTLNLEGTWAVTPSGTVTFYLFGTAAGSGGGGATPADIWAYSGGRTLSAATNITSTGGTIPITASRVDATVGAYQTGLTPLQPTVAGRTFDVSATGGGGVDWSNVEAPTTTVGLSGTTISTTQAVASVAALGTNAIASTSIAADAYTAAKFAADVGTEFATATWASGTRTLTTTIPTAADNATAVWANGTRTLTAGTNLPTVAQITSGVWSEPLASYTTPGTAGYTLTASGAGGDPSAIATAVWASGTRTLTSLGNGSSLTSIPWNSAWDAEVQSEVADALAALTITEPSGKPAWGGTPWQWIGWMGAWMRNEIRQTATDKVLRNDANNGTIATCAVTDDSTTLTVAECTP